MQKKVEPKESVRVSTEIVKCKNCGSNMEFDPKTQKLLCNHCGNLLEIENCSCCEIDLASAFDKDVKNQREITVFKCDNCGAKVELADGETSKECPFCGTPHVESIKEMEGLKPSAVLPFRIGVLDAVSHAKEWAKKKFFAPRRFKKTLSNQSIKGVYAPCFTFDSVTTSIYEGRLGRTQTRVVGSGKNQRVETYTVWFHVSGTYYWNFDDILITAGKKFDQKQMEKISPFDTNNSKKYDENYLMGYMSYHYDQEISDCWDTAKSKMDKQIRRGILSSYSYDKVAYLNVSTTHEKVTYKYVLIPVYVGNFNYNGKLYNYYINGETAKIKGKTPVSILKVAGAILLGLAVIGGIVLLALSSST